MRKRFLIIGVAVVAVATTALFIWMKTSEGSIPVTSESASYYALGDSVAAGIGLPTFSDASACDRTNESYPSLVAESKGYRLTNLACSGATIESGAVGPQTVNDLRIDGQFDQMLRASDAPDILTITIGANDIDWTQYLACYAAVCSADLTSQLAPRLQQLDANLSALLERIRQQYEQKMPTVVVTGYYGLLATDDTAACTDTTGLDVSEKKSIKTVFDSLNQTLEQTTKRSGFASFAAIDFTGHELCTGAPWIQGIADTAPFHPNEDGQRAIAKQLASVIQLTDSTKGN